MISRLQCEIADSLLLVERLTRVHSQPGIPSLKLANRVLGRALRCEAEWSYVNHPAIIVIVVFVVVIVPVVVV